MLSVRLFLIVQIETPQAVANVDAIAGVKGIDGLFIERAMVDRLVRTLGVPDARLRVNLIMSYLIGIGTTRYVVRIEPIASMPEDDLVKLVAPTIQNWLDPTKPLQKPKGGSGGTKPTKTTEPKPRTDS